MSAAPVVLAPVAPAAPAASVDLVESTNGTAFAAAGSVSDSPIKTTSAAIAEFVGAFFWLKCHILATDGYEANLKCDLGLGIAGSHVGGAVMIFTSWDDMCSGSLDFKALVVGEELGLLQIMFTKNGREIGYFLSGGEVVGAGYFSGTCTWSRVSGN